jgi:hypothetical protein
MVVCGQTVEVEAALQHCEREGRASGPQESKVKALRWAPRSRSSVPSVAELSIETNMAGCTEQRKL